MVGIGNPDGTFDEKAEFTTTDHPAAVLDDIYAYLDRRNFDAIGLATFGPVDLDPDSPTWGYLQKTPRNGWQDFDLAGPFQKRYQVPVAIETDVNAAVLAERAWGAGKGRQNVVYVTIGSGIGGGAIVQDTLVKGTQHAEMGHIPMVVHPDDDFVGTCPFHHTCLEGLATSRAIFERWGCQPEDLPEYHDAWDMEAWYIAQALTIYIMTLCPEVLVVAGGIMNQKHLFPKIRQYVYNSLGGYYAGKYREPDFLNQYIVESGCPDHPELCGALYVGLHQLPDICSIPSSNTQPA